MGGRQRKPRSRWSLLFAASKLLAGGTVAVGVLVAVVAHAERGHSFGELNEIILPAGTYLGLLMLWAGATLGATGMGGMQMA